MGRFPKSLGKDRAALVQCEKSLALGGDPDIVIGDRDFSLLLSNACFSILGWETPCKGLLYLRLSFFSYKLLLLVMVLTMLGFKNRNRHKNLAQH